MMLGNRWTDSGLATPARPRKKVIMPLSRDFKHTVRARVRRDPAFAEALLGEMVTTFLNGDIKIARLILRDLMSASRSQCASAGPAFRT